MCFLVKNGRLWWEFSFDALWEEKKKSHIITEPGKYGKQHDIDEWLFHLSITEGIVYSLLKCQKKIQLNQCKKKNQNQLILILQRCEKCSTWLSNNWKVAKQKTCGRRRTNQWEDVCTGKHKTASHLWKHCFYGRCRCNILQLLRINTINMDVCIMFASQDVWRRLCESHTYRWNDIYWRETHRGRGWNSCAWIQVGVRVLVFTSFIDWTMLHVYVQVCISCLSRLLMPTFTGLHSFFLFFLCSSHNYFIFIIYTFESTNAKTWLGLQSYIS